MSPEQSPTQSLAYELRRSFDESFARPAQGDRPAEEDFLTIELGEARYVLRLAEIARVSPIQAITRFPTPLPQLLGIAGVRGLLVPVYDLAACLEMSITQPPRWLAIAAAAPLALAFPAIHSYVRIPFGATAKAQEQRGSGNHHVREILRHEGRVLPVISLSSLVTAIQAAVQNLPQVRAT